MLLLTLYRHLRTLKLQFCAFQNNFKNFRVIGQFLKVHLIESYRAVFITSLGGLVIHVICVWHTFVAIKKTWTRSICLNCTTSLCRDLWERHLRCSCIMRFCVKWFGSLFVLENRILLKWMEVRWCRYIGDTKPLPVSSWKEWIVLNVQVKRLLIRCKHQMGNRNSYSGLETWWSIWCCNCFEFYERFLLVLYWS